MNRILVATDLSTRSDRALRRATLLARQMTATLTLVHVIDDDRPSRVLAAERVESSAVLEDLARTVRDIDGVACEARLLEGEPFDAIARATEDTGSELVVMGPHRRQPLRDIFVGTTIDRTIRRCRRPVLMANAVPAGRYVRVLVATDFSDCSAAALRAAEGLGFLAYTHTTILHAFDAPVRTMALRTALTREQTRDYIAAEEEHAAAQMAEFLRRTGHPSLPSTVQLLDVSAAETIRDYARTYKADLVVIGAHGRISPPPLFLGSVVEEVLRGAEVDVLVVPHAAPASANAVH